MPSSNKARNTIVTVVKYIIQEIPWLTTFQILKRQLKIQSAELTKLKKYIFPEIFSGAINILIAFY